MKILHSVDLTINENKLVNIINKICEQRWIDLPNGHGYHIICFLQEMKQKDSFIINKLLSMDIPDLEDFVFKNSGLIYYEGFEASCRRMSTAQSARRGRFNEEIADTAVSTQYGMSVASVH